MFCYPFETTCIEFSKTCYFEQRMNLFCYKQEEVLVAQIVILLIWIIVGIIFSYFMYKLHRNRKLQRIFKVGTVLELSNG